MPGNRRWQPKIGTKEIDRSGLAVVVAEDRGAFLIFGTQVIINMPDGRDHFLPTKLIGENLWQRIRRREIITFAVQNDDLGEHDQVYDSKRHVAPPVTQSERRAQPSEP